MSDDDWGDDGWDDNKGAAKKETKPAVTYEMGEVIDDFYPDNHEDLALMRYDLVYVFKRDGEWWEGEVNGIYGRFPGKYVQLLKDKPNKGGEKLTQAIYYGNAALPDNNKQ